MGEKEDKILEGLNELLPFPEFDKSFAQTYGGFSNKTTLDEVLDLIRKHLKQEPKEAIIYFERKPNGEYELHFYESDKKSNK